MKSYRYTRDLEGAPEGTIRKIAEDEAAPLLKSGALVESDEDPDADETDAASTHENKGSVSIETKPRPAKAAK